MSTQASHPVAPPSRPAPLPSLTSLRAIAVTGVFLTHAGFWYTGTGLTDAFVKADHAGRKGVLFFFMLSGAILAYNYPGALSAGRFYRKRVARIYPVFLLAFVAGVVVLIATQGAALIRPKEAVVNALMLQGWFRDSRLIPPTAWTLSCEALFYLLFPVVLPALRSIHRRHAPAALLVLLVTAAVLPGLAARHFDGNVVYLSPLTRLPEFMAGCLIGLHLPAIVTIPAVRRLAGRLLWGCGLFTLLLIVVVEQIPGVLSETGPFVLLCAVAIVAAAAADVRGPHRLGHPWLVRFGLWSYAFYSFHVSVLAVVDGAVSAPPGGAAVAFLGLIGTFALAWLISAGTYRWWEEPWRERLTGAKPAEATLLAAQEPHDASAREEVPASGGGVAVASGADP